MPRKFPKAFAAALAGLAVAATSLEAMLRIAGFEGVALYETRPDGFYRMRPGLPFLDGGKTNHLGLRGDLRDPTGIVLLGDSVVFGTGLRPQETIPVRLAELSGINVLNGGMPGYGAREPALLVEKVFGEISSPLYVELLTANDVTEASRRPLPPPFWMDTRERHSPVRLYELGILLGHYWKLFLVRTGWRDESARWTDRIRDPGEAATWVSARMKELEAVVKARSGALIVVLSPWNPEQSDAWTRAYEQAGGTGLLLPALKGLGIDALTVPAPPAGAFADDLHFTPSGARWMAGELHRINSARQEAPPPAP